MHHKVQEIAEPRPLVRSLPIDDGNFAPVAEDVPRAEIPVLDGDRQVGTQWSARRRLASQRVSGRQIDGLYHPLHEVSSHLSHDEILGDFITLTLFF